jgi:hypothetical protein
VFVAVGQRVEEQRLGINETEVGRVILGQVGVAPPDLLPQACSSAMHGASRSGVIVVAQPAGLDIRKAVGRAHGQVRLVEAVGDLGATADVASDCVRV